MAEFKLGRIKFVWQGEWALDVAYVVDDVVSIGGKSFICVRNHTAGVTDGTFAGDLNIVGAPKWNLVSDGTDWQGNWSPSTYYNAGAQVKNGGVVYVCVTAHTSATNVSPTWLGLEQDQSKWAKFAETFFWTGEWATSTKYRLNDFVSYGGVTYVCNAAHISAASAADGLEVDSGNWDIFNKGITYLGNWTDSVRYKENDVVKYGASTWICVTSHTSTTSFDDTKFNIFVEGLEFESSWSNVTVYQIGDTVTYGGYSYIAKRNNVGSNPSTGANAALDWAVYTTGFNFRSDYDVATAYKVGDVVRLGSYTYLAVADSVGNAPPNLTYWNRLNSGVNWTNPQEVYTSVTGTLLSGIGQDATFDITRTGTTYSVEINNAGQYYAVGNEITVLGSVLGGLSPVNDLTITVTAQDLGEITDVSVAGISSTWTEAHVYVLGDLAFFGANSYICVAGHVADNLNRPDSDTTSQYWNLFAAGSESAVLTVAGDTYFYGENGPTRLPIGTDGQILRVRNSYPEWTYYGVINNVVYVAPTGTNSEETGWGLTIDKPWASVRYACDQVRNGYLNRNATLLLKKNKQFLMKEITNWITFTYNVSVTGSSSVGNEFTANDTSMLAAGMPIQFTGVGGGVVAGTKYFVKQIIDSTHFTISDTQGGIARVLSTTSVAMTGSLSYDSEFCERDTGLLVDAVVYDLGHGGSGESTKAAKAYYTFAGNAYINSNFGQQAVQTVAAYNYLKELISDVLSNTAPTTGYQEANGVTNGATQYIDLALVAESGTGTVASTLLSIVTDGILAGSADAIPASTYSNTTVFVKTGTYNEVLPIIIPNYTAVVGDELRGTVISPNRAIANLVNDKSKTVSALDRIKSVIPNVIANNTVVVSDGNTDVQQYLVDSFTSTGATRLGTNINIMTNVISTGASAAPALTYPDPVAYDANYANARRLTLANKSFLIAEVTAYMVANYNSVWTGIGATGQAACTRDIGYIVDALAYDLTYGGNLATVIAARAYYSNGVLVESSNELVAALSVQLRLKDIIDNIITGNTAGWTKSVGNSATQDTSGTPGSAGAATFAQARVQEVYDTINSGTAPTTIAPSSSWVNATLVTANTNIQAAKTAIQQEAIAWTNTTYPDLVYDTALCSRDVGYIVDALCYDMMFGGNFLSVQNALSYHRALASTAVVTTYQLQPTLSIIGFVGANVKEIANTITGSVGSVLAENRIVSAADAMYDVINNGVSTAPNEIITDPSNLDANYAGSRTQISNNYAFLKAEISAYLNVNYNAVWTALGVAGQASCQRDVGYILDALRYDLTYGGNTQSLIVGSSYYSYINLVIADTEKTATLAAYTRLKNIIDDICSGTSITRSAGNVAVQSTSGAKDLAGVASVFAQDRVQDIIDWIDDGTSPAAISPNTAWVSTNLVAGFAALQAKKSEIKLDGLGYVHKYFQDLTFNETTCSRDIGFMIDAIGYDMMFNSNFASIIAAKSYYRGISSAQTVLALQKDASLGLVNFLKYKTKIVAASGAIAQISSIIKDTTNAINGGSVPRFKWPDYTGIDSGYQAARTLLSDNKKFFEEEVIAYISENYSDSSYNQSTCSRDVGLIVDALSYDLVFGSNYQSVQVGLAYLRTQSYVVQGREKEATIAALTFLKTLVAATVSGDPTAVSSVNANMTTILAILSNGLGSVPSYVYPNPTGYDSGYANARAQLVANRAFIVNEISYYLNVNYNSVWTTINQATCQRDTGYLVDALIYDLTYGGNLVSLIVGNAYYSFGTLEIASGEVTATLAAYARLKSIVGDIAQEIAITRSSGNVMTQDVSGTAGSSAAATFAQARVQDIYDIINTGTAPASVAPVITWAASGLQAAFAALQLDKARLQARIIEYVNETYAGYDYNQATCARDVGYIIDALRYDLTYGGNLATRQAAAAYFSGTQLQIDSADKTATLAAYTYLNTLIQAVAVNTLVTPLQTNVVQVRGTAGSGGAATQAGALMQGIIDTIESLANLPASVNPGVSWVVADLVTKLGSLIAAKSSIIDDVSAFIGAEYPNLVYDVATCERDVGILVDAVGWDMVFDSNYQSVKAGMSYYRAAASKVVGAQKKATLDAYRFLKGAIADVVSENATATARVKYAMSVIISIIEHGIGMTPETTGTVAYNNNVGTIKAVETLRANKAFLQGESTAWISNYFGGTVTGTSSGTNAVETELSHHLTVGDPVIFRTSVIDAIIKEVSSTGNLVTLRTTAGMYAGQKFTTVLGSNIGNITSGTIYYIKRVVNSTQLVLSASFGGVDLDPGTGVSVTPMTVTVGDLVGGIVADVQYYVLTTPTLTSFTYGVTPGAANAVTLQNDTGSIKTSYSYNEAACRRDMGAYIDALIEDLQYVGNHKSLYAALVYNNAVSGSELSDMFWVSNSTGLRNCTLSGLNGQLTDENAYGTKRPTAGAFVALNPGFGPQDSAVWVKSRSHYSQNITMFGTGCTGAKIDSSLHAGGNKSMVKNDFTTIISDGIGVWCTGSDSLTELVSVFNYYGYAGYLAEKGGRIRATNGNSSYGTYGVIAEGVSSKEVPIYGTVDNRAYQAQIASVVTDGTSEVLRFEFGNAGSNYTNTVYTINQTGFNATAIGDEYRDASVFETRIVDLNDENGYGGSGYVTQSNAAQTGNLTSITIAATDTGLSNTYNGMRIQVTGGTGVGQYANILTYGGGSKIATVFKDSFTPITVATTTDTGNFVNVVSNATLYANMPIYFTGTTFGNITANTLYYVKTLTGTTQFTISTEAGGTAVDVTTGSGSMTLLAAGWDHLVPGTAIANALDLTSAYVIEPRINYTAPGYTATARTLSATSTWNKLTYGDSKYVAIPTTGTTTTYSTAGTTWATAGALSASASWIGAVYGGGEGATATAVVGGLGGKGAIFQAVFGVPNTTGAATADQIASVTVIDGGQGYTTPPVMVFTPTNGGTGARATATVLNGKVVQVTVDIPGSGYNELPTVTAATDRITDIIVNTSGRNYTSAPQITISGGGGTGGSATASMIVPGTMGTFDGVGDILLVDSNTITEGAPSYLGWSGTGYTSTPTVTILDTGAKYIAMASGGQNCHTTSAGILAGSTWTAGTATTPTDIVAITYGSGQYVAVGAASAVSSATGLTWTSRVIPTLGAGTYSNVAFGNGTFVAIATGTNATAVSANGSSWSTGGNMPSSAAWSHIAYGNGRFVAITNNSRSVAISTNKGAAWTSVTPGLPVSATWTSISYGQGLFIAVASGTAVCATSPDGVTWTERAMPSSSAWNDIQFGNTARSPLWVAISSTSGTIAASIRTGATALGRVKVGGGVVSEIRMIEPGSGYPKGSVTEAAASTNIISTTDTTNLVALQSIEFDGCTASGLAENTTYYVVTGSIVSNTSFKVATTLVNASAGTAVALTQATGLSGTYRAGPTITITDPNDIILVATRARLGDGALGNPSFSDRGQDQTTATADTAGDGFGDLYQNSTFINVAGLYAIPEAGANVEFASLPGVYFKLVTVTNALGVLGNKTATFQINPGLTVLQAPSNGDMVTTRLEYSQVRLTGHDFLYTGTGGVTTTNYPGTPLQAPDSSKQSLYSAGGRVFFTSTDQDGNFNVGNLFGVQQATGTATLNASAFNLSGLNSLQLGSVELGIGSAVITQFSTDPYFTANSDSIVPTQRAIRAYITAQIGGGQSSLNVNTLTSGVVYVAGNSISTTTGVGINVTSKMNFTGGIDGAPVALGFFMQK